MGLFTPKISSSQLAAVNGLLKKANESADIINKTVQPDVFFRRICFLLFCLKDFRLLVSARLPRNAAAGGIRSDRSRTANASDHRRSCRFRELLQISSRAIRPKIERRTPRKRFCFRGVFSVFAFVNLQLPADRLFLPHR